MLPSVGFLSGRWTTATAWTPDMGVLYCLLTIGAEETPDSEMEEVGTDQEKPPDRAEQHGVLKGGPLGASLAGA
jgi:hypothetical protein